MQFRTRKFLTYILVLFLKIVASALASTGASVGLAIPFPQKEILGLNFVALSQL